MRLVSKQMPLIQSLGSSQTSQLRLLLVMVPVLVLVLVLVLMLVLVRVRVRVLVLVLVMVVPRLPSLLQLQLSVWHSQRGPAVHEVATTSQGPPAAAVPHPIGVAQAAGGLAGEP